VGAPFYLDGYAVNAALPLVQGLVGMGMDTGAALALLISGAAVRRRRQAIAQLEQLSDHQLRDLGFSREQVSAMKVQRARHSPH
jgi:uncharacterized protein YjiS (DUF1127 family)